MATDIYDFTLTRVIRNVVIFLIKNVKRHWYASLPKPFLAENEFGID